MIDSDVVIDHLADIPSTTTLLKQLATDGIAVSIITYMEAYQGVLRSPHPAKASKHFAIFLELVPVLPFTLADAKRCAQLRETQQREGKRVKTRALDLMIAATILEHGLTLVTRNVEDYDDIRGLNVYKSNQPFVTSPFSYYLDPLFRASRKYTTYLNGAKKLCR
jgi:tRNA(fMet)-specific endonuclease VapC